MTGLNEPTEVAGPFDQKQTRPPKVMIVEDEAIIALDIQRQLVKAGFRISGRTQSGRQALQELEREKPDLVLMDINLGGEMDGVEAAAIIRDRYDLPVIYLTANADDATLKRALATEPFGYLLKPLVTASLRVAITVALYKHRTEGEIRNSRRLLSAILHGVPEAVLVADLAANVSFLNRMAEEMTGWTLHEAFGKKLVEVAPIFNNEGRLVLAKLLQEVSEPGTPLLIPGDSKLAMKDGRRVEIAGRVCVSMVGDDRTGSIMTLQEVSSLKGEGQRIQQEQQMFVVSEMAQHMGRELFALFGVIDEAAESLSRGVKTDGLKLIREASRVGGGMSHQLLALRQERHVVHAIDVKQDLEASKALLQKMCGKSIGLEISATPGVGYVLSTGNHFEQLLVNLVLEGRRRVGDRGSLFCGADVHPQPDSSWQQDSYVRLFVKAEKPTSKTEDPWRVRHEWPGAGLALVHAIALSAGGFSRVRELGDRVSIGEVFLPRYLSSKIQHRDVNTYSKTILLVGFPAGWSEPIRNGATNRILLIEATDLNEARWIAQMYNAELDLVVCDVRRFSLEERSRAREGMLLRRPELLFMDISAGEQVTNEEMLEMKRRWEGVPAKKFAAAAGSLH